MQNVSSKIYHGGARGNQRGFDSPGGVSLDEKVKISVADTTPDFLNNKALVGGNIVKILQNPGGNENLLFGVGNQYTLVYNNMDIGIVAGDFLCPPDYTIRDSRHCAYNIQKDLKIKTISILAHRFQTTGIDSVNVRFRSADNDGSYTAPFATGGGTLIGTITMPVLNTGGLIRYYHGGFAPVDWDVAADQCLFCYVQFSDIDVLSGLTVWVHLYQEFEVLS